MCQRRRRAAGACRRTTSRLRVGPLAPPVPGPANEQWTEYYKIPPNVKAYYAFLMENENLEVLDEPLMEARSWT
jgi:hypothetical protein